MAVYRGMDIGTPKPTPEQRAAVPYHLIDLVDPGEEPPSSSSRGTGAAPWVTSPGTPIVRFWWGGPGSTCARWLTTAVSRPISRGRRLALEDGLAAAGPEGSEPWSAALAALHDRLTRWIRWPPDVSNPPIDDAWCTRWRSPSALEARFSSFGPGLDRYPPASVSLVGMSRHQAEP